ncbi:MAG: trehalose-phosphatase [Proteobacteria bacterium]|nr:trehalose-phosphatase [Pseudomonadota bacterium]
MQPTPAQLARQVLSLPKPILLAFDVDGTLAPIVSDPRSSRVPPATVSALTRLAAAKGLRVALVTGRDAASLDRVVRIRSAWRAVEHGALVIPPRREPRRPELSSDAQRRLAGFASWVHSELVGKGATIERKPRALAVHVRDLAQSAPGKADRLLMRASSAAARQGLSVRHGRCVLEAEIAPGDKGRALAAVARRCRARGVLYVGDDLTDLPAIRLAAARGGFGVFVRSEERPRAPGGASASLSGTSEVHTLVDLLCSTIEERAVPRSSR